MSELRHQEIIDRVHYMYLQTDGTIEFPNSFEGDLLKIAYGTAVQSIKQPELNENQQIVLDWLKKIYNKNEIKMNISAVFWVLHQNYLEDEFSKESLAYEELSFEKESQVVKVFINLLEKEESE